MRVCKLFTWDSAHKLQLPYDSPCNHLHGHTYTVEVEVEGPVNDTGMVVDFKQLKELVNTHSFDHSCINYIPYFDDCNPTAEHLVSYLYSILKDEVKKWGKLRRIRVWETPTSYAEEVFGDIHGHS